jgi:uncharacterized membrane protein
MIKTYGQKIRAFSAGIGAAILMLAMPLITFAQWYIPDTPENLAGVPDTFAGLAQRATNIALAIVSALSVIFLVYGAIQYVTSRGDTQAAEKAKSTITYAIIGIVIAILAFAIVNIVFNLTTNTVPNAN